MSYMNSFGEVELWTTIDLFECLGRRVADAAVTSDHPYGIVARCGLGWVEIYLEYKCLELPRRPEFYKRVVQE